MGDMDLIPLQTKPHSLAESSDVGRRFLRLGPGLVRFLWVSCCPVNSGFLPHMLFDLDGWRGDVEWDRKELGVSYTVILCGLFPLDVAENEATG